MHQNKADVIVFEYLEMKTFREEKQKLQMWKTEISKQCSRHTGKGIEFPRYLHGTQVGLPLMDQERLPVMYEIIVCTFQTGKRYNCDLSAAL